MHLRLGIDLDGVVADFNAGWITRYNDDFGADLRMDAVQVWDGIHQLTHFPDMEAFWEWGRAVGDEASEGGPGGSIFRYLETYEGAVDALQRLQDAGHEVVILTTKPDWSIPDTFAWIADHRIPTREVHMLFEKWRVPCDVYLDDAPHQIERIHKARPESLMCRFVRPWNRPAPGVRDIHSWSEFEEVVARLGP